MEKNIIKLILKIFNTKKSIKIKIYLSKLVININFNYNFKNNLHLILNLFKKLLIT